MSGHVDVLAFRERIERRPIGGEPEEPPGLQPLAPEGPRGVLGAWIGNESLYRGLVAGIGTERAIFGGGEQRLIGHRLPEVVREPRCNLIRRELEIVLSAVDGGAVDLHVVEKRRRQQQLGHRHPQHFDRWAHPVVEGVKAGHLVGGQGTPKRATPERVEEGVEAGLCERRGRCARATDRGEAIGSTRQRIAEIRGHVEERGHVVDRDAVVETVERSAAVVGHRGELRGDVSRCSCDAAHRQEILDGVSILKRRQPQERSGSGIGAGRAGEVGVLAAGPAGAGRAPGTGWRAATYRGASDFAMAPCEGEGQSYETKQESRRTPAM